MTEKTPAEKMMFRPGNSLRLVNAPADALSLLGGLPAGVVEVAESQPADIMLLFANNRAELEALLPSSRADLAPGGRLWVAYHKGSSPVKTDINRDSIWAYAKTIGMEAVSNIAINDDWSTLRLKLA